MTTLKCNKIKNVEKSVCTAEQKVAYNYAHRWQHHIRKKAENARWKNQEMEKGVNEVILKYIVPDCNGTSGLYPRLKKFNVDAITIAFRQALLINNYSGEILTDYNSIGKIFTIPYEVH